MVVGVDKDTAQTQQPAHRRTVSRWEDHTPQTDLAQRSTRSVWFAKSSAPTTSRTVSALGDIGGSSQTKPSARPTASRIACVARSRRVALFEHEIEADKVDSHRLDRLP